MFLTAAYAIVGNAPAAAKWRKLVKAIPQVTNQFIRDMRVTDNAEAIAQMEPGWPGCGKRECPKNRSAQGHQNPERPREAGRREGEGRRQRQKGDEGN